MTVDEIVRTWRDPEYLETLPESTRIRIPRSPAGSVAVLDREIGPSRVDPLAINTCTSMCGDTCPTDCNYTCGTSHTCCC